MSKNAPVLPVFLFKPIPIGGRITYNDLPMVDEKGYPALPLHLDHWYGKAPDRALWSAGNFQLGKMWVWAYLLYLWQGGPLEDPRFRCELGPLLDIVSAWQHIASAPLLEHPFVQGVFEEIDYYLSCSLSGDASRREMLGWIKYMRPERWNQCVRELHAATTEIELAAAVTSFVDDTRKETDPA